MAVFDGTTEKTEVIESLEGWVGDDKKFATNEDLAKSYGHTQNHISTIEKSYRDLQAELENRETVKEMLTKLNESHAGEADQLPGTQGADDTVTETMTPQEIAELIDKRAGEQVSSFVEQNKADTNEVTVSEALSKQFGGDDQAAKMLSDKAAQVGLSMDEMRTLARGNPKVVLGMFPSAVNSTTQLHNEVNTDSPQFSGRSGSAKNFAYYETLRKENKREYFKQSTQMQIIKDADEQGPSFYEN